MAGGNFPLTCIFLILLSGELAVTYWTIMYLNILRSFETKTHRMHCKGLYLFINVICSLYRLLLKGFLKSFRAVIYGVLTGFLFFFFNEKKKANCELSYCTLYTLSSLKILSSVVLTKSNEHLWTCELTCKIYIGIHYKFLTLWVSNNLSPKQDSWHVHQEFGDKLYQFYPYWKKVKFSF